MLPTGISRLLSFVYDQILNKEQCQRRKVYFSSEFEGKLLHREGMAEEMAHGYGGRKMRVLVHILED